MLIVLLPRGAAPAGDEVGGRVALGESEAHHLRVRRTAAGEPVALRDGAGLVGTGRLVRDGRRWAVEIEQVAACPAPPTLALAVGAGDRERFGWLVEKATELGATALIPLETVRTAGVATRLRDGQYARLRARALEAVKQCGAAWAPEIEPAVSLDAFLDAPRPGRRWLADPAGEPPPARLGPEPLTVAVGPEGGFTAAEREAIVGRGWTPVRLAEQLLRFETAAIAAAACAGAARLRGSDD